MSGSTSRPAVRFGRRGTEQLSPALPLEATMLAGVAVILDPEEEVRLLCLSRIDPAAVATLPPARLAAELGKLVGEIANEHRIQLNSREQRRIADEIAHDMLGFGPLESLLMDDSVADIMVNGPSTVFVERNGKLTLTDIRFRDDEHLYRVCQRIAAGVGRRVDEASPWWTLG